jgi:hypothetical protein
MVRFAMFKKLKRLFIRPIVTTQFHARRIYWKQKSGIFSITPTEIDREVDRRLNTGKTFGYNNKGLHGLRVVFSLDANLAMNRFNNELKSKHQGLTLEHWASVDIRCALALSVLTMMKEQGYRDWDDFTDRSIAMLLAHDAITHHGFETVLPPAELELTRDEENEIEQWSRKIAGRVKPWPSELMVKSEGTSKAAQSKEFDWFQNGDAQAVVAWLKTQSPSEWHVVSEGFNWDYDPETVLGWIVRQKDCDLATALNIFLLSEWSDFESLGTPPFADESLNRMHALVKTIFDRLVSGQFASGKFKIETNLAYSLIDSNGHAREIRFAGETWQASDRQLADILPVEIQYRNRLKPSPDTSAP